nr:cobyric acid synthase CobQ [Gammaproteobacteria bacterium]NIR95139.1 cobyric acid synthase CobQ [Gammaproteobacteria bacterium]NIW50085.1 cobyric acid synthase CobQ [Gammaproteobacteria bacterium]NIX01918.1 cobyric acid synthase CobQ [Phycisphaerae bacterium]
DRDDGAISQDNRIMGTYLHGLFDEQGACKALLEWAGLQQPEAIDYIALREREIDRLADVLDEHLDVGAVLESCRLAG